ncbi:MAG: methyltransferase, TIGR04325 family [Chitinophagaceae bacterium]
MDKLIQYLKRFYIRLKYYRYGWKGNFSSWQQAINLCGGYNKENILNKIKSTTLKVKSGEAVYERDGMLSDEIEYSWPLLTHMLQVAVQNNNQLSLIDFGGSLGTSYFQNRHYLNHLKEIKWSVVEQDAFVSVGKNEIAEGPLSFFYTIEDAIKENGLHQILLLSCVLPYLEKPFEFLALITKKKIPYIIIENTYFNPVAGNRLTIQKVPPVYYEASYPAWFLDYDQVINTLQPAYDVVAQYNNEQILYLDGQLLYYRGLVMKLKDS